MSMHHLLQKGLVAAFVLSVSLVNQARAQDILSSTGVSTRSYSYVEIEYLTNSNQDTPFLINGLLDIAHGFAFTGRYTNQSEQITSDVETFIGEATADLFTIGLLYHNQLLGLSNTDWFAEFGAGRLQLKLDTEAIKVTQGINLFRLAAGVRQTLTERIELELATDFLLAANTSLTSQSEQLTISARGVFRVTRNFDVALSLTEVPTANIVGLGLRLTF